MKTRTAYWTCQAAGWGLYSAMGLFIAAEQLHGWRPKVVVGYVLFFFYSIALTDLLRREIRRRQWLSGHISYAFLRILLAAAAIATLQTFLVVAFDFVLQGGADALRKPAALSGMWFTVTAATVIWTILYVAITAPRRSREKEVHFQLTLREAELRALEAQVNPHFLFNCLNSIRGLVAENPPLAQDMITRLANILRYNLHRDPDHTVPLAAEVEIVSDYLAIESVRFEDRLRVALQIDPSAAQASVPPMLLQTLVENAIKHGIATLPEGGDLLVRATSNCDSIVLEVENTGAWIARPPAAQNGLGLANARERLRLLYGDRASLDVGARDGRVAATVRLPKTP